MTLRIAAAGFRHGHMLGLIGRAQRNPDVRIVACAEDDAPAREAAAAHVRITHTDPFAMIGEVDCDIILIGDYFSRRGALTIEALRRGRHVLGDKPLATDPGELARIGELAGASGLAVGCQLNICEAPTFVRLRQMIRAGDLGEVHQIMFGAQHPLMYGKRASWYFEPGKHGGTLNDIAIHAAQLIPWLTGKPIDRILAARAWNAFAKEAPHFKDSAQVMFTLANGAGVLGDVSYAMPDTLGYQLPQYWRMTCFGTEGMAETSYQAHEVSLTRRHAQATERLAGLPPTGPDYFDSFLHEVRGEHDRAALTTADVLLAATTAMRMQQLADRGSP